MRINTSGSGIILKIHVETMSQDQVCKLINQNMAVAKLRCYLVCQIFKEEGCAEFSPSSTNSFDEQGLPNDDSPLRSHTHETSRQSLGVLALKMSPFGLVKIG